MFGTMFGAMFGATFPPSKDHGAQHPTREPRQGGLEFADPPGVFVSHFVLELLREGRDPRLVPGLDLLEFHPVEANHQGWAGGRAGRVWDGGWGEPHRSHGLLDETRRHLLRLC